jgi:hypothetical protein
MLKLVRELLDARVIRPRTPENATAIS